MGKNLQNYFGTTGSLAKITCRDDSFTLLQYYPLASIFAALRK